MSAVKLIAWLLVAALVLVAFWRGWVAALVEWSRHWQIVEVADRREVNAEFTEFDVVEKSRLGQTRTVLYVRREVKRDEREKVGPDYCNAMYYTSQQLEKTVQWYREPGHIESFKGAEIRALWEYTDARRKYDEKIIAEDKR